MQVLFFLTVLLLFGVGLVIAQTDRQDVMANWDLRRCDLGVILASNLYKPSDDSRSSTKFATDNLKFCTNKIIQEVFTVALNPYLSFVGQQFDLMKVVGGVMVSVKAQIGQFFRSFSRILGGIYERFIAVGFNFRKTFVMFLTAMNRAFGIATSTLFMGMSMIKGIENFYNAVINIVMIVIAVLAAVVIILFLAFFPVIPFVLTTISVLVAGAAAGVASAGGADGFKGVFCFSPNTLIQTMRGLVEIKDIQLGDILADGGKVEGILNVNGSGTDIYNLRGVRVSGDHLVFYEPLAKWILVKEHPEAHKEIKQEPLLVCLNTSTREVPIQGIRFRDWEEIPVNNTDMQKAWNELIANMLGSNTTTEADQYPVLSGAWFVQTPEGKVALRDIQMGTKVLDIDGSFTKVLGIYEGLETTAENSDSFWYTDSIWWKSEGTSWAQKTETKPQKPYRQRGFHLVTGSGTFKIFSYEGEHGVRDFTEVGQARIAETYEWMKGRL